MADGAQDNLPISSPRTVPYPKMSVADFAGRLKLKYPQYSSIPDDKLVESAIEKYPVYRERVDLGPLSASPQTPPGGIEAERQAAAYGVEAEKQQAIFVGTQAKERNQAYQRWHDLREQYGKETDQAKRAQIAEQMEMESQIIYGRGYPATSMRPVSLGKDIPFDQLPAEAQQFARGLYGGADPPSGVRFNLDQQVTTGALRAWPTTPKATTSTAAFRNALVAIGKDPGSRWDDLSQDDKVKVSERLGTPSRLITLKEADEWSRSDDRQKREAGRLIMAQARLAATVPESVKVYERDPTEDEISAGIAKEGQKIIAVQAFPTRGGIPGVAAPPPPPRKKKAVAEPPPSESLDLAPANGKAVAKPPAPERKVSSVTPKPGERIIGETTRGAGGVGKTKLALDIVAPIIGDSRGMGAEQRLVSMWEQLQEIGSPQDDLAILTNHVGMTLAAQRGARITKAFLEEAMSARSVPDRLNMGIYNLWNALQGNPKRKLLTDDQKFRMVELAKRQYILVRLSAGDRAKIAGVKLPHVPDRVQEILADQPPRPDGFPAWMTDDEVQWAKENPGVPYSQMPTK